MDFGALPPEINSGLMYSGPGSGPMVAAATAWNQLAAELDSAASSYTSIIAGLTDGPWMGPASAAMAAAATPYVAWTSATAGLAQQAAAQAMAAAGAYHAAFSMTVPPPVVAANRAQLASLVATNFLGQNTPAIMANEAQYAAMWAQDAAAMYGYAGNSAAASAVTPFTAPPQAANPAGPALQAASVAQASGTGLQSTLSQLLSTTPMTLQSLTSPASPGSGLSSILSGLLGGSSPAAAVSPVPGLGLPGGSFLQSLLAEYAFLPGFFGLFAAISGIQGVLGPAIANAMTPAALLAADVEPDSAGAWDAGGAWDGAAGAWDGGGAWGGELAGEYGSFADVGGWTGLGEAVSVGDLSVPPSWAWAAAAPEEMLGGGVGAGLGFPPILAGLPRAAAVGAAAGVAGAAASKYGSRLKVMARPPAAGYPDEPPAASGRKYPVPAGYSTNGHAPAGYRAALVYVPVNGQESAPHDK
jgi:PPE-repeat protein